MVDANNSAMASNVTMSNDTNINTTNNNSNVLNNQSNSFNNQNNEKENKSSFLLEFVYSFFNIFYLAYRGISYPLQAIFNASSKTVDDAYQQAKFMNNTKPKRNDDLDVIIKKIKDF